MPNPNQPTIFVGAHGDAVKRLERALRRTPNLSISVDGDFTPQLEGTVKSFQSANGLTPDGRVGPLTWAALPDGRPMPVLQEGASGAVVKSLQQLLTNGAQGTWNVTPQELTAISARRQKPRSKHFRLGAA
jgi:peptidoglycan hydrolase-like protein with peptidoglycan-binding domain